ncbi:MAG: hypothetical protein LBF89_06525 [Bacteroidales bacterium]|jgi:hypothetical protein|nr:hypothetical protein [Bacteroidales bacterium]
MRKAIVLFLLMGAFCRAGRAQDKIITVDGDTIFCRITDVSAGNISYEQRLNDGRIAGRFISSDRVDEYFREPRRSPQQTITKRKLFRVGVEGGYGHLLSSFSDIRNNLPGVTSGNMDRYLRGMKNGIHLGASFHFLFNEHIGIGVKYSFFSSGAELTQPVLISTILPLYDVLHQKERFYFNYIAPSLFLRQWLDRNRRFALNESVSLGGVFFRNEARGDSRSAAYSNYLLKSKRLAADLEVSLEYYLLPELSVSANIGAFYARIKNPEIRYVDSNNELQVQTSENAASMDMSRLNFSAGLHFYF